jgi:tetratricopeptide (TPR) repeat protein
MVPFGRNEVFVGRENVLAQLLERIPPGNNKDACQRTIIEGLGGIGKTQVTIEAAYRIRDAYPDCSVFWVPALDLVTFENAYLEIGRALKIQGIEDGQADVKGMVKAELSRDDASHWLMVIDNADDKHLLFSGSDLMSYLPFSRKGSIVVTTRNHQVAIELDHNNIIHLKEMSSEEATELLHTGLNENQFSDDKSTVQLLEQLSFLPLAIRQASAYMACNSSVTVSNYLGYCQSNNETLIRLLSKGFNDQGRYNSTMNPIAKTWLISFEQISRDNELAAEHLKFICYVGEKNIPTELSPQVEDEIMAHEAIGILKAYSFVVQRGSLNRFDIHRLVRLAMQNWLHEQGQHTVQIKKVLCRLAEIFPCPDAVNREVWTAYMPHVQAALVFQGHCPDYNGRQNLMMNLAESFYRAGKDFEAQQLLASVMGVEGVFLDKLDQNYAIEGDTAIQKYIDAFVPSTGPDNLLTLLHKSGIGDLAVMQRRYDQAEKIYRYVIDLQKIIQGTEHPDVLSTIIALVAVLRRQGKYQESESMLRPLIKFQRKLLASENPDALRCLGRIAQELQKHDKHQESVKMLQMLLKSQEKLLGPEHPDVLISMDGIAQGLREQGKHQESVKMLQMLLKSQEKLLGPEHPDVLISMDGIAQGLREQGKHQESLIMLQRLFRLQEIVLGPDHPKTLFSMKGIAQGLREQGKHQESLIMLQRFLKLQEMVDSSNHPETLLTMQSIAIGFLKQGQYQESEAMLQKGLKLEMEMPGLPSDSLNTLKCISLLANHLGLQGNPEAERLYRQVINLSESPLGITGFMPSRLKAEFGYYLASQGKWDEAEQMLRQALEQQEESATPEIIKKFDTIACLAMVLSNQGKFEEAEQMHEKTLEGRIRLLGRKDPKTIQTMVALAEVFRCQGKSKEAQRLDRQRTVVERNLRVRRSIK